MSESAPIEHPSGLTSGDFTEAEDPLRLFATWFEEATRSEPRDPTAMSLATVDADGLPNVRMVLMKSFGERGFVFYTNVDSQKGLGAIPRPPNWTGYRLRPLLIEFWQDRPFRLHDRVEFRRDTLEAPWQKTRLYP